MWARRAQSSSKQQLSDEFLEGFRACEETPKVKQTAVCTETGVDDVWQVLFCLMEHDAEEHGEQVGARTHPCLTPLEVGMLPDSECHTWPCSPSWSWRRMARNLGGQPGRVVCYDERVVCVCVGPVVLQQRLVVF